MWFLSCEPMLGDLDLEDLRETKVLVLSGGEHPTKGWECEHLIDWVMAEESLGLAPGQ